jgi:hypothetical protein
VDEQYDEVVAKYAKSISKYAKSYIKPKIPRLSAKIYLPL